VIDDPEWDVETFSEQAERLALMTVMPEPENDPPEPESVNSGS
jgi:hypothetical protein